MTSSRKNSETELIIDEQIGAIQHLTIAKTQAEKAKLKNETENPVVHSPEFVCFDHQLMSAVVGTT